MADVTLIHDYLTQRGGAERVVLALAEAFPGAEVVTSLYDPLGTFPQFATMKLRTLPINHIRALRRSHRLAMPLLAPSFSAARVDSAVAVCSSSGWAHGANVSGRKIVYCHNPARWLYQPESYLAGLGRGARLALASLQPALARWDRKAALSAARYVVNSNVVKKRVQKAYGIDAQVVHPPFSLGTDGSSSPISGIDPGFVLCVSRLMSYKNVDAVIEAFRSMAHLRLVVVGSGPQARALKAAAPPNVTMCGEVDDATLRWCYTNCAGLVAASYEDFGLTPVEGAAFGKPTAALRWGGFLETVVAGTTGVFFDTPEPRSIALAVSTLVCEKWEEPEILAWAGKFSPAHFEATMQGIVSEELSLAGETHRRQARRH